MHGTELQERTTLPGTSTVRRDVARHAVPHAGQRVRDSADGRKQRPIQSMEEARDWERRFIGEIKAGRDPRLPANRLLQLPKDMSKVSPFLDAYLERCVKPPRLRSISAGRSRVSVLKEYFGELSL